MNKKLLAIAVTAVAVTPVAALADGPTLYGQLNVSLENVKDSIRVYNGNAVTSGMETDLGNLIGTGTPAIEENKGFIVRDNASRLGVKGEAETGITGVSGIYQAEFGFDATGEAAGLVKSRDIFVGVKGSFGTVRMGYFDSPFKKAQGTVDQFNDSSVDMEDIVSGETRVTNAVQYTSPKLADVISINLMVAPGEQVDLNNDGKADEDGVADAMSASVVYDNAGIYAALAYNNAGMPRTGGYDISATKYVTTGALTAAAAAGGNGSTTFGIENDTAIRAVIGYTAEQFEVAFLYEDAKASLYGNAPAAHTDLADLEDKTMLLSGAYKMGAWKFKAEYGQTDADAIDEKAKLMAVGADYALGKATTIGAFYAKEDLVSTDATDSHDGSNKVLSVGFRQKF